MDITLHRYANMVQEYYVARVREARRKRLEVRAKLRTRADVLRLQEEIRTKIRQSFGRFPARTPLRTRITGKVERRHYTVEKILFESRPGLVVSANLYLPKGLTGTAPGVLGLCGHTPDGKAHPTYQWFVQGLALKGFVTLIIDPIGQGERAQYPGPKWEGVCVQHNLLGNQQALLGEFFGAWRAWDAVRGLDYLLSRPEVDGEHVGVTGNSGGGTMTTWLCGLDERITMAAPGCFVTTLLANMENELPADVEQIPPHLIEFGLDECDFFIPFAPKPLILLTEEKDYFDQRGSQEAYRELKRIYGILGADGNLRMKVGTGSHGYSRELREAMYAFFGQHSGVRISAREPRLRIENQETLCVSRTGVLVREGSKRVFDFTRAQADELLARRKPLSRKNLKHTLAKMLVLPKRSRPPHFRILAPHRAGNFRFQNFVLETEPGIQAVVTMPNPPGWRLPVPRGSRCSLLVPHLAACDDLRSSKVRRFLGERTRTFAVDPRGIGQSMSASCEGLGFFASYDSDYFYNAYGLMLGEPYLGRRVHDVLSTLDWLFAHGYREIHVVGRGMGAVLALLACTLDERPSKVTLINGLLSFHELTQVPIYGWPASSMLSGMLKEFDLPDCYRALAGKLRVIEPWDARMRPIEPVQARRRLREMGVSSR